MDPQALATVQEDLERWGLVERGPPLAWSRRLRGAVMRAAMRLAEEEKAGRRPEGHPMETAVRAALADVGLPDGAVASREHVRFLVGVEMAALPEGVKRFWER